MGGKGKAQADMQKEDGNAVTREKSTFLDTIPAWSKRNRGRMRSGAGEGGGSLRTKISNNTENKTKKKEGGAQKNGVANALIKRRSTTRDKANTL